ncbi:MAG TPA: SMC-Scp complex subunit ScpB, partial [Anaeromyxobacteraceae bacterium]|nr:SMC-Scp complex subunit ScpB [Anaeromyxobacteraceae bacterium]
EREAPPEVPSLQGLVAELADPNLRAALEKGREEGDAALDELEAAIDRADESSRSVRSVLDPEPPPAAPGQGEGEGGGSP